MLYAIITVIILILDQSLKFWTTYYIDLDTGWADFIPGLLRISNHHNSGIAFGLFSDGMPLLFRWLMVALIISFSVLIIYLLIKRVINGRLGKISAVLILGGALGNGIDRAVHGFVVDMLEFELFNFPIFNIADICVTVGAVLFCVYIITYKGAEDKSEALKKTENDEAVRDELTELTRPRPVPLPVGHPQFFDVEKAEGLFDRSNKSDTSKVSNAEGLFDTSNSSNASNVFNNLNTSNASDTPNASDNSDTANKKRPRGKTPPPVGIESLSKPDPNELTRRMASRQYTRDDDSTAERLAAARAATRVIPILTGFAEEDAAPKAPTWGDIFTNNDADGKPLSAPKRILSSLITAAGEEEPNPAPPPAATVSKPRSPEPEPETDTEDFSLDDILAEFLD